MPRPTPTDLRAALDANGGNLTAVGRQFGVSRTTIRTWLREAEAEPPAELPSPVPVEVPRLQPAEPPLQPVVIRHILPESPWYTRVPWWVWSVAIAGVLIVWAFHLW